eukprot:GHVU01140464.1.p1 GENE.GHVU01140464.1~~GHVU01140464.1.p1  ORF type:complete len:100 (+),score=0.15 GHVU01140464.1:60-359(+)
MPPPLLRPHSSFLVSIYLYLYLSLSLSLSLYRNVLSRMQMRTASYVYIIYEARHPINESSPSDYHDGSLTHSLTHTHARTHTHALTHTHRRRRQIRKKR